MVQHANNVLLGNNELGLEPLNLNPEIQEGYTQTIATMQGFKKQQAVFGNVRINRNNALLVTKGEIYPEAFVSKNYGVSVAPLRYKVENSVRKALFIKNMGYARILFSNTSDGLTTLRTWMYAGQYVLLEEYTFELWMVSFQSSVVQVVEYF